MATLVDKTGVVEVADPFGAKAPAYMSGVTPILPLARAFSAASSNKMACHANNTSNGLSL